MGTKIEGDTYDLGSVKKVPLSSTRVEFGKPHVKWAVRGSHQNHLKDLGSPDTGSHSRPLQSKSQGYVLELTSQSPGGVLSSPLGWKSQTYENVQGAPSVGCQPFVLLALCERRYHLMSHGVCRPLAESSAPYYIPPEPLSLDLLRCLLYLHFFV